MNKNGKCAEMAELSISEAAIPESCNSAILSNGKDVGGDALFLASSTRDGFGLQNLRDDNALTYWQSNGSLPHHIDIIFSKFTKVSSILLYISSSDESYAPKQILVQSGTDSNDLSTVELIETNLLYYWQECPISSGGEYADVLHLRIIIRNNHFNGIDSRIHQLLILGPETKDYIDLYYDKNSTFGDNSPTSRYMR